MSVEHHPEYEHEKTRLANTFAQIEDKLDAMTPPVYGADQRAARAVLKQRLNQLDRLKQALEQPYFGRVDWSPEDGGPDTFYIGKFEVSDMGIYSWRHTMPASIYYNGKCKEPGERLLRRTFRISDNRLVDIIDEFKAPQRAEVMGLDLATVSEQIARSDELLLTLLEQTRGGHLHDIVATIQQEQFRLISAPLEQILIIQGVPGSGKTAIALHRLAYLLYQHEEQGTLNRNRVLYLAPNPIFLSYVAKVLPELGERGVPQMAFDDWMLSRLGIQLDYEPEETALESLLEPEIPVSTRIMHYRNARNKGSMKMAELLSRYVEMLGDQIVTDLGEFEFKYQLPRSLQAETGSEYATVTLGVEEVRNIFHKASEERGSLLPLNQRKANVQWQLTQNVVYLLADELPRNSSERVQLRDRARKQVDTAVAKYLRPWEALNVSVAYRALLRSPDMLQDLGQNLFNRWDLELMHFDAPKQGTPFRFSDLGALMYLQLRLDGTNAETTFDYLVVDEAQDIAPIQFAVLSECSRNQAMTIMGDVAQSIYSDIGLRSWDELGDVLDESTMDLNEIRRSYRSTQPIIEYASAMMRRIDAQEVHQAEAVARSGEQPREIGFADADDRLRQVQQIILEMQADGWRSIAIVVKTAAMARAFAADLQAFGIDDLEIIDARDCQYKGGVAIIPVYLAKGLEFDVVVLADADSNTYPAQALEARLLYVAVTRASHRLFVGRIGEITPLLDSAIPHVTLADYFEEQLTPDPVTVEEFAQSPEQALDPDACVERLASANKLYLMGDGRIDYVTQSVLAGSWNQKAVSEEIVVPELDGKLRNELYVETNRLMRSQETQVQDALGFMQLIYSLLRNTMRGVGIMLSEEEETDVAEQAIALVRLLNAIDTGQIFYSAGPRTTARRALESVDENRQPTAQTQLHHLIEHGLVETFRQVQGERIRVHYDWIEVLLQSALGHDRQELDADLDDLLPRLPHPLCPRIQGSKTSSPVAADPEMERESEVV